MIFVGASSSQIVYGNIDEINSYVIPRLKTTTTTVKLCIIFQLRIILHLNIPRDLFVVSSSLIFSSPES